MSQSPGQPQLDATAEAPSRLQFEEMLADLSARFVNVPADAVEQVIRDALRRLCQSLDLDRASLWQGSPDEPEHLCLTHLHTTPACPGFPPNSSGNALYPWATRRVLRGETLVIADTAKLPPEAAKDRETFQQAGVQSGLILPLITGGGQIVGALAFGDAHCRRNWAERLVTRCRLAAQVFANTLARQRTEEAIRASECNYREVFNATTDAIFIHDADTGAILDVNDAMTCRYGFTRGEAVHLGMDDISLGRSPYSRAEAGQWLARAVADGPQVFEWRARRKDGELFWVEVALRSATINGQRRVLAAVRDISRRKRAEDAARASEDRFRHLFDSAADALFVAELQGRFVDVNAAACQSLGYTREELLTKSVSDIEVGQPPAQFSEVREQILTGQTVTFEGVHRRRDGSALPVELHVAPLGSGDRPLLFAVARDLTERKQAEMALQRSLSMLRATLESTADGILVVDLEGRIVDCNQRFLDLWRFPKELLIPGQSRDLITSDRDRATMQVVLGQLRDPDAFIAGVREAQGRPESPSFDSLHFKDGRVIERYSLPQRENGRAVGRVWSFRDVTARSQAEDELRRARDEAQLANQAKDRFLAMASHELRTPLTPAMLVASILEKDPRLPPELRAEITLINQQISIEKRLIDDLLDFVAIQSAKLQLELEPTHLHHAIQAALDTCRPEIERNSIALHHDLRATHDTFRADPWRLRQILWNILLNAAKFTPPGGSITVKTLNPDPASIQIVITDTGKGIDRHTLAHMFQPFEQGPRTDMHHYGGLGLGLAITRILTEAHHGTITAASAGPDRGATFTLRFPLAAAPADVIPRPAPPSAAAPSRSLRILLVEDHEQTRQVLTRVLQVERHTVTSALSIAEALEAAAREPFDLLLSDLGLPDGSGLDLMRRMRRIHPIRGIAVSGYTSQTDRQAALDAGFCEHLSKPISMEVLRQAIRSATLAQPTALSSETPG